MYKDKRTKGQKVDNVYIVYVNYNIIEVLCCILGTCTFLFLRFQWFFNLDFLDFWSLGTSLLCIVRELVGVGSVAVTVGGNNG